ncbi:MAG TPA: hypothetical protein VEZ72_06775 [Paenibacillus sp.]|nr:hypothetical protein [Paenibacillus sp.]
MREMHPRHASEKEVYVLLTDTGTRFTRVIKAFTNAPYNHASIALDPELKELYSFGRKRPTNPWRAGFIREDVREGTFRHFPNTRCALLRLRVSKRQRSAILAAIDEFRSRSERLRYNLIGLVGVPLRIDIAPKDAYFCSQFVAELLRGAGRPLWNRPSALVTPHDFLRHPAFELVYEGELYDYPGLTESGAETAAGARSS